MVRRNPPKPGEISSTIVWMVGIENEKLANVLRLLGQNIRSYTPTERQIILNEAAKRIANIKPLDPELNPPEEFDGKSDS